MRAGARWVRERLERRRILALLDRLDALAARVELLDLPKRWARDAQELAEAVRKSVRDIREFVDDPVYGAADQNGTQGQSVAAGRGVNDKPRADSVSLASRVSNGPPGRGFPDNVHEFLTMCAGSGREGGNRR